jgi:hypothetical protein
MTLTDSPQRTSYPRHPIDTAYTPHRFVCSKLPFANDLAATLRIELARPFAKGSVNAWRLRACSTKIFSTTVAGVCIMTSFKTKTNELSTT